MHSSEATGVLVWLRQVWLTVGGLSPGVPFPPSRVVGAELTHRGASAAPALPWAPGPLTSQLSPYQDCPLSCHPVRLSLLRPPPGLKNSTALNHPAQK